MKKYIKYKNNYLVSDHGEIFKITKGGLNIKKLTKNKQGYLRTSINGKMEYVHRIVLTAFIGKSNLHVDHLNMDKSDNRIVNLEYVTQTENNKRRDLVLGKFGKFNSKKVIWNNKIFESTRELDKYLGVVDKYSANYIRNKRKLKGFVPYYEK